MGNYYKFPNENVSNSEKDSLDFALKYGQAILASTLLSPEKRKAHFDKLRKYAKAKQPINIYKEIICNEYVSVKYLNVNWEKRINILPRYLRKAYNSIDISEFKERFFALNPEAIKQQEKNKKEKKELFYNKEFLEMIKQTTGQSIVPEEEIPNSLEEIELDDVIKTSLDLEIGEEIMNYAIKQENSYDYIFNRVKKDVFVLGVGVAECYTDSIEGVKLRYVNPDYWGHSPTEDPTFSDCTYFYQFRKVTLREFRRICEQSNIRISEDEIDEIVKANGNSYAPNRHDYDNSEGQMIEIMDFTFKTYRKELYKEVKNTETGFTKLIDRTKHIGKPNAYNPNPDKKYKTERIDNSYEVWYEGVMTTRGKEKVISYNLAENMSEYRGKIISKYIAIAPRIDRDGYNSLTEEAIPTIDELQILDYKRQHLFAELKGNITDLDVDAIAELKLGGKTVTTKQALELYFSKSIRLRKSLDSEGNFIGQAASIQQTAETIPYAVREVVGEILRQTDLINNVFGYRGADEAKPHNETLYPQEPYRLSDNLTLKDIFDYLLVFNNNVSQTISSRLDNVFKFLDVKEKYISMVGADYVNALQKVKKDRASSYFGCFMEIVPTKQEREQSVADINTAHSMGQIQLLDAMELRIEKNPRIAMKRLKLRIKQRQAEIQDSEMNKINGQINANAQSAITAQEEKRKTETLLGEIKAQLETIKHQNNIDEAILDGRIKLMLEKMNSENKKESQDKQHEFEAMLKKYTKDREEQTRLNVNRENTFNREQIEKLKKGEIDNIYGNSSEEPNLSMINQ